MRFFKLMIAAGICAASATPALAADPRVGTLACVIERAFVVDPKTGDSGEWADHPRSFVAKVSICEAVVAGQFETSMSRNCINHVKSGLVLKTTLVGEEDVWSPASAVTTAGDTQFDGGVFDSALAYPGRDRVAARLVLRPDLTFDYIRGASIAGKSNLAWWTMQGVCTPFEQ